MLIVTRNERLVVLFVDLVVYIRMRALKTLNTDGVDEDVGS